MAASESIEHPGHRARLLETACCWRAQEEETEKKLGPLANPPPASRHLHPRRCRCARAAGSSKHAALPARHRRQRRGQGEEARGKRQPLPAYVSIALLRSLSAQTCTASGPRPSARPPRIHTSARWRRPVRPPPPAVLLRACAAERRAARSRVTCVHSDNSKQQNKNRAR